MGNVPTPAVLPPIPRRDRYAMISPPSGPHPLADLIASRPTAAIALTKECAYCHAQRPLDMAKCVGCGASKWKVASGRKQTGKRGTNSTGPR